MPRQQFESLAGWPHRLLYCCFLLDSFLIESVGHPFVENIIGKHLKTVNTSLLVWICDKTDIYGNGVIRAEEGEDQLKLLTFEVCL